MPFVFGAYSKPITTLLLEALVVAVCLVLVVLGIEKVQHHIPKMTSRKLVDTLLVAGVLIHIGFELTGVNQWYSLEYCKLQK